MFKDNISCHGIGQNNSRALPQPPHLSVSSRGKSQSNNDGVEGKCGQRVNFQALVETAMAQKLPSPPLEVGESGTVSISSSGRVRRTPHVAGDWPSLIYIPGGKFPVPPNCFGLRDSADTVKLSSNVRRVATALSGALKAHSAGEWRLLWDDEEETLGPHVSLSKPFSLRYHQIRPFRELLLSEFESWKDE